MAVSYCLGGGTTSGKCAQPAVWILHGDCTVQISEHAPPGNTSVRPRNEELGVEGFEALARTAVEVVFEDWLAERCEPGA